MPADTDPATVRINDDLIIDVERDNGGPTNSCQPDKTYPSRIPDKMVGPRVLTGVKYRHWFAGQWIGYSGCWPLEFVSPPAGKTQVGQRGLIALDFGEDVVYNHGLASISFGCLTIGTTVVVCCHQLTAQFSR